MSAAQLEVVIGIVHVRVALRTGIGQHALAVSAARRSRAEAGAFRNRQNFALPDIPIMTDGSECGIFVSRVRMAAIRYSVVGHYFVKHAPHLVGSHWTPGRRKWSHISNMRSSLFRDASCSRGFGSATHCRKVRDELPYDVGGHRSPRVLNLNPRGKKYA